jgi:hypothetical protein
MQRHGGQTRPAGEAAAKAATKAGAASAREGARDGRDDARVGNAPNKSNESKD